MKGFILQNKGHSSEQLHYATWGQTSLRNFNKYQLTTWAYSPFIFHSFPTNSSERAMKHAEIWLVTVNLDYSWQKYSAWEQNWIMNFDCDPNLPKEIIFIWKHHFLTHCFHICLFKNKTKLHLVSRHYSEMNGQKFSLWKCKYIIQSFLQPSFSNWFNDLLSL